MTLAERLGNLRPSTVAKFFSFLIIAICFGALFWLAANLTSKMINIFFIMIFFVMFLSLFLSAITGNPKYHPVASPEIQGLDKNEFGVVLNTFTGRFKRCATSKAWKIPIFEVVETFPLSYSRSVVLPIKGSYFKEAALSIEGDFDPKETAFFVGFGSSYELECYIDKQLREVVKSRVLDTTEVVDDEKRVEVEAQVAHEVTIMCLEKQIPFSNISTQFTKILLN